VALVTGGSRGVGRGIALALGSAGWTVCVTGRGAAAGNDGTDAAVAVADTGSPLEATAAEVTARGGTGVAMTCDHRDDVQVTGVVAAVADRHGRLDLLVNNVWAGPEGFAGFTAPFWERPLSDWDPLVGIGLRAHYVASAAACRVMVGQRSGLIVNISSFGGRSYLHSVAYGIAKAGLDKMAHDMAVELVDHGVTALSLWPGLVQTESVLAKGVDTIAGFPIAEAETPEFVGRVIAALAADPEIARRSGQTLVCAEVAAEYGVVDADGRRPASHRAAFGGGPFFGPPTPPEG
jgi:NAD(P)-dependent dehydrogenase (short-subunit alcohol dehydrogenase family)